MKNYAITLPCNLIEEIALRCKRFEIRTRVPDGLVTGSRIVVVQKGTHGLCRIQLRVKEVHLVDWLTGWSQWKDWAGIPFDWYKDYVAGRQQMYWIEFVYEGVFDDGIYIEDFGIHDVPQWFSILPVNSRFINTYEED